ncbi:type I 3-dehydroquinase-domain-containing protein [Mycena metata]|uniref:shikimate kinase n=1 Tax=Mycena metata TaxID=1033252 RepID=A0AAD7KGI8_9AGAR|nr:type I 3-dehydroquinase-domain-containing protein [Mycena metata]
MNVRDLVHSSPPTVTAPLPSPNQHMQKGHPMSAPGSIPPSRTVSPPNVDSRKASIVLIGMRGVGKTTLATITARALGWELFDTDIVFERQYRTSIVDFVASQGWDAFRQIESDILHDLLRTNRTEKVIACGGGVVELERNRALLHAFKDSQGLVIHVLREKDCQAWDRREKFFRECCSFNFVSLTVPVPPGLPDTVTGDQTLALKPVEDDFFRLLRFVHGIDTNKVPVGRGAPRSYCLSLTFDDVAQAIPKIEDLSLGIDAWELRVDLLASLDLTFLAFQIAILRRHSPLPIIFTLWRAPNGDRPLDPQATKNTVDALFKHALRLGVEYVELDARFPRSIVEDVVSLKGNTTILGSFYDTTRSLSWNGPEVQMVYNSIVGMGADIVKIVYFARSYEDNLSLQKFVAKVDRPIIALNLGAEGQRSRVLNHFLTPVSHPLLPRVSFPGQLSFYETQTTLSSAFSTLLPKKKYYLFGCPIAHSMSPTFHNTAFATLGLPHTYELKETRTVQELADVMRSPDFGCDIIPLLQHVSRHAKIIGAVNTISPIPGGGGYTGDNTDWRAIKTCLLRYLTPANAVTCTTTALVLGAGGTSRAALYALYHIGVINIYISNRTRRNAEALAREFERLDPLLNIRVLDRLTVPLPIYPPPTMVISTIPATADGANPENGSQLIDIGLHSDHLSPLGGVAIELAYERRITSLLALAEEKRAAGVAWTGVEGIELLLEQGYEQCRIWTARRAPKAQVRQKVLEVYHRSWGKDLRVRTADLP